MRYLTNLIKTAHSKIRDFLYIKLKKLIRVKVNLSKRVVGDTEIVVDSVRYLASLIKTAHSKIRDACGCGGEWEDIRMLE